MALYSIGEVAERCGINPITLRAWQRRYGLLKPQRSEGGHRRFDDEDVQRIEEIKRLMASGVSVGKVKILLEDRAVATPGGWETMQEEMMTVLRQVNPAKLRAAIADVGRQHPVNDVIDHIVVPVRKRLTQDHNTARTISSLFDGALIDFAVANMRLLRKKEGKATLLMGWDTDDRTRLWLEAWRLAQQGWRVDVLAEPLELLRPEMFPGQHIFVWTGKGFSHRQQEQLAHWQEQGYTIASHGA